VKLIVIAGAIALMISLLGTPLLIRLLQRRGLSQAIRRSEDGVTYPEHEGKRGTPSMGGLAIIAGTLAGYGIAHLVTMHGPTTSGLLAIFLMVGLASVGVADDYLKIFKQRSTGVLARTKLIGQSVIALSFAFMAIRFVDDAGYTPSVQGITAVGGQLIALPLVLYLAWTWFLVAGVSNAVNLTDGLDGLATGAATITIAAYVLVGVWEANQNCERPTAIAASCYHVRDPLDLAVFAAACGGALVGFLWWNTSPAGIFMGDTGSLAIGGAIAALAMLSLTELLLAVIGGLFLIVTMSVILQVGSFKLTGKRIFRMAPIHHHFELMGWPETQIVVRMWIVQALMVSAGLGVFYYNWIAG
jgi:phospho-N-acetylmuramoyl-pentapeptide-transferase